jgi:hypothetical protein
MLITLAVAASMPANNLVRPFSGSFRHPNDHLERTIGPQRRPSKLSIIIPTHAHSSLVGCVMVSAAPDSKNLTRPGCQGSHSAQP